MIRICFFLTRTPRYWKIHSETAAATCINCHVLTHYASRTDKTYLILPASRQTMDDVQSVSWLLSYVKRCIQSVFFFFRMSKGIAAARELRCPKMRQMKKAIILRRHRQPLKKKHRFVRCPVADDKPSCRMECIKKKELNSKCIFVGRHVYALTQSSIRI